MGAALTCREVDRAVDAYVDGELEPSHVLSVDHHLTGCAACSERVAIVRAMKRAVRGQGRRDLASDALRARIARSAAALRAEPAVPSRPAPDEPAEPTRAEVRVLPPSWRSALPWAAAAAVAFAIGGGVKGFGSAGSPQAASVAPSSVRAQILEEFAIQHARPLPPEEIDPVRITKVFSPIVGVPVRPVRFAELSPVVGNKYSFAGARLMALRDEPAATLFYDVGGTRVTVFVFDPHRITVRSECCLIPKVVSVQGEEKTILVGHAKGYSLAIAEKDGVGYALSADLSEKDILSLAAHL